jgi:ActR/RegA family two-component response regulator
MYLKQSTAVDIAIGPFVDSTDGFTPETGLSITQAETRLKKNNGAWAQVSDATSATHEEEGWYEKELDATDTDTLGILIVAVYIAGALPVWQRYQVLPANVYDSLVLGTDFLQVDAVQFEGADASDLNTKLDAIDDFVDTELAAVKTVVDAIKVQTDLLPSDPADQSVLAGLITAVDDFVDTELAAVKTVVDAIKLSTDNLPSDPADASVIAGLIAAVSAKVDAVDDLVDTEVAAIKTVVDAIKLMTDNLPSDPADASVIAGLIAALEAKVDTVDNLIDTEVAAIKAVTDLFIAARAEPTTVPVANETPLSKIDYIFAALRNRLDVTATKKKFYDDAGVALWEKDLSDDGDTYTETEGNAP